MSDQSTNSAFRLIALVGQGQSLASLNKHGNPATVDAKRIELHQLLEHARTILREIEIELKSVNLSLPEPVARVFSASIESIRAKLAPANLNDQSAIIGTTDIAVLQEIAAQLTHEKLLGSDEREKLRDSIEALKRQVESSDLPRSVREAMQRAVRLTQEALDEYLIRGGPGFKRAFREMLGDLFEVYLREEPAKDDPPRWWKDLYGHVVLVDAIASRLLTYTPTLEAGAAAVLQLPSL